MSAQPYVDGMKAVGINVLAEADLGNYQGDWVGLVAEDEWSSERWGFSVVGYGSCSGCDAWQAARTAEDRAGLIVKSVNEIKWFDTLDAAKAYILSGDQALEWHAHESGWPGFLDAVRAVTS